MQTKTYIRCKNTKPVSQFGWTRNRGTVFYSPKCRECHNAQDQAKNDTPEAKANQRRIADAHEARIQRLESYYRWVKRIAKKNGLSTQRAGDAEKIDEIIKRSSYADQF